MGRAIEAKTMVEKPHPRLGVAAVISNADGKFLVGKRKGSLGAGTLGFPGGHLEHGEHYKVCAERETLEETGLEVEAAEEVFAITNNIFEIEEKHYTAIFIHCKMRDPSAVPRVMEPGKCEGWEWKSSDELKQMAEAAKSNSCGDRLFLPLVNLIKKIALEDMDLNTYIMSR